ncbi:MAG: polysaccharide biosynthesis/export family protein [Lentimicrobiaceae bacterium]|nr:polysaccharide biosynthesis/export family protein [Lentimicrobiaceae bacterium]MCB9023385.1 polysaccharide biosynthesis/export family protein [Lentimicrobiaceae bacterium]MCO5266181.1 polysaccharide biosynthesis/export family protein [Lentimicrobium sp.]
MNNKKALVLKALTKLLPALCLWVILFSSCIPQKKMLLMQYNKINDSVFANNFVDNPDIQKDYKIQPNDYLYVNILSIEKEITDFLQPTTGLNYLSTNNQSLMGYYVNEEGNINFPYLGNIKLGGLTIEQAHDTVKRAASSILGDRIRIEVRLINNTVNIIGEVNKEGLYNMTKSKITILEALTLAGGMTNYAKRQKLKVLRTINGKKVVYLVDVTSGKLIENNMFYVFPNDVVYVEPMRAKSIGLTPTFSLSIISSLLTTTITVFLLFRNINAN